MHAWFMSDKIAVEVSNSWQKTLGILEKLAKRAKIHLQQFGKHI